MTIILSPTKQMGFPEIAPPLETSRPRFIEEARHLASNLASLDVKHIKDIMSVSQGLAEKTFSEFQAFGKAGNPGAPALFAYHGTAFKALDSPSLDDAALEYAQDHLRILSGLYGVLKPSDLIEAYRLEMGARWTVGNGQSLQAFWKERISQALSSPKDKPLLNLASAEYAGIINPKAVDRPVITVDFKQENQGKLRTVGHYSKVARGTLARRILLQRPQDLTDIKDWFIADHRFQASHSSPNRWVFVRNEA